MAEQPVYGLPPSAQLSGVPGQYLTVDRVTGLFVWTGLFDATAPSTQAFGDAASHGDVGFAADAGHKHAMMTDPITALQAMQLTNEIKGWPPIVNTGNLDALNLWWRKLGTPTGGITVCAVSGEGGVTLNYKLAIKCVAAAANDGIKQTWTYADEPRVKAGRSLSSLWAIWCVGGVGCTVKHVNSDASHTDAAKVTAAAWTIIEVPNHTLAGTTCDVQLIADGAGTFYAVPLGVCIGARGLLLAPRPTRLVDLNTSAWQVSFVDPGGTTWTDLNLQSSSSPLAVRMGLKLAYRNYTAAGAWLGVRRKGSTSGNINSIGIGVVAGEYTNGNVFLPCNDGQVVEWGTSGAAAEDETAAISLLRYEEWA